MYEVLESYNKKDIIEEIVDVLEVVDALKKIYNITNQETQIRKDIKVKKNG